VQERRDLTVILGACFVVFLMAAFVIVALIRGIGHAVHRFAMLAGVAVAGTVIVFVILVVVAYFDAQARRRITHEASRLEEVIRQQQKIADRDRTD
jgi:uncharacterized membrane protein